MLGSVHYFVHKKVKIGYAKRLETLKKGVGNLLEGMENYFIKNFKDKLNK